MVELVPIVVAVVVVVVVVVLFPIFLLCTACWKGRVVKVAKLFGLESICLNVIEQFKLLAVVRSG